MIIFWFYDLVCLLTFTNIALCFQTFVMIINDLNKQANNITEEWREREGNGEKRRPFFFKGANIPSKKKNPAPVTICFKGEQYFHHGSRGSVTFFVVVFLFLFIIYNH